MKKAAAWCLDRVQIVTANEIIEGRIVIEDGRITAIEEDRGSEIAADVEVINGNGGIVMPGFIDLHVHGGNGRDFMEATGEAFDTITRFHAAHGTTTMLATTVTAPHEALESVLRCAAQYREQGSPYAELAGVHLEGPFISSKWPGAQNPDHITKPKLQWLQQWAQQWPSLIKQLTLAPETEGAFELIAWLDGQSIIAAAGHTDATYDIISQAAEHGLKQAVHTYNAMKPLHHREPGTLGAVLTNDQICAELIADGHHVHPAAINLLLRAKPLEQVVLITDAMSAAGLGDGSYLLGDLTVVVKDGVARLAGTSTLAGSTLTMIEAVRYMKQHTSLTLPQISRLASLNPARQLGIDRDAGTIDIGKRADLVWTDASLTIQQTWVKGKAIS